MWDDKLPKTCPLMLRRGEKLTTVRGLASLANCWEHLSRHVMLGGKRIELGEENPVLGISQDQLWSRHEASDG